MDSIFKPRNVKFNNVLDSEDFNKMNKELGTDLTGLFQTFATEDNKLDQIIETLQVNNQQLANRISFLENQINNMDVDKEYIDFYRSEILSYGEEIDTEPIEETKRAYINNDYNVATLKPVFQNSKTFLYNKMDDEVFLPEDLRVGVTPKEYTDAIVKENDIKYAFDQDISTQWKRKVVYDINSPISSVNASIEITLPKSIINNMYSNTIFINPYPDSSLDIVSVEYTKINSEGYFNFQDEDIFRTKENSNNVMLSFEKKPIEKIRINIRQRNAIDIDSSSKMFMMGIQNIAVYNIDYIKESSFYAVLDPGTEVKMIKDITPILENTEDPGAVQIDVFAENLETNTLVPINIGTNISTNYNQKFWIKVTINKTDGIATPVLKGMTVDIDLFGQIIGIVKSSYDNSPILNANVELFVDDAENRTAVTESSGGFTMINVRPGNYTMKVSHADYIAAWYNVDVNANRTTELELIVQEV
jgi:hypothetical protein